jgi:hypothetical protein
MSIERPLYDACQKNLSEYKMSSASCSVKTPGDRRHFHFGRKTEKNKETIRKDMIFEKLIFFKKAVFVNYVAFRLSMSRTKHVVGQIIFVRSSTFVRFTSRFSVT